MTLRSIPFQRRVGTGTGAVALPWFPAARAPDGQSRARECNVLAAHHWRGRRSSKSHLRRPKDFPLEPQMSEAMCRSGERMRTRRTCRARFELGLANVMGGDSGVGRVRCGVRATVCYGRNFGRWAGPLWRSSYHMLWEEFGEVAGPAVALQLPTLTLRWSSSSSSSLLIPPSSSHLVPPSSFLRLPCPPSSSLLPPPLTPSCYVSSLLHPPVPSLLPPPLSCLLLLLFCTIGNPFPVE